MTPVLLVALFSLALAQSYTPPYPAEPQGANGRSYNNKFDGPFNLINVTSPCPGALPGTGPYCLGAYANAPKGVIGYWPHPERNGLGTMSASLQHAILPTDNLTFSQYGTWYAGSFHVNPSGSLLDYDLFVWHQPITSSNPYAIPLDDEVRCFQWFNDDNLLRLFITTTFVDCTGEVVAELYWARIDAFNGASGVHPLLFLLLLALLVL